MKELKNFIKLLDPQSKKSVSYIILINFIISLFEFLSVASIYPFLIMLTNETKPIFIENILGFFKIEEGQGFYFFITIILSFLFVKNIMSIYLNFIVQNFLVKNFNYIALSTIKKMLGLSYIDIINLTSPIFIRNTKEIVFSARNYLMCVILLYTEIILITFLILLLFLISFEFTLLTMGILTLFLLLISSLSKSRIQKWGKERNELYSSINSSLIEIFNSFRELKIYSNYNFYLNNFKLKNFNFSIKQRNIEFFSSITRYLFEIIVVVFLSAALFLTKIEISLDYLPTIGIFVFSFFRLYPSFTKISYLKTVLRSNLNSINILEDIQNQHTESIKEETKNNELKFDNFIKVKELSFGYDGKKSLFKNLNLTINKGEIIGITGKNGSGKTTLCNIILSLIRPQSGLIQVDDRFDVQENLYNYRKIISFIPQNIFLLNDTIKNNITFNLDEKKIDHERLNKALKVTGLSGLDLELKNRHNSLIGENGSHLSGGQRQRIAIARAVYRDSEIIIMDEHTSSLDLNTEKELLNEMKQLFKNKTLIIISHKKQVQEFCDKNYLLENCKLSEIKQ